MINDSDYWDKFYKSNNFIHEPSSFAQHVCERYLKPRAKLLELGCGNGRDSIYFAEKEQVVTALDFSAKTIDNLNAIDVRNAQFIHQDFSKLSGFSDMDYVYSRFTMHSVDEETEQLVFSQMSKVLKMGGLFLMEARSLKDEKLGKTFGTDHFRRYLDYEATISRLESLNFRILEKQEGQGLSPYKDEDPYLMRVIAERAR